MTIKQRANALVVGAVALAVAVGLAACGGDDDGVGGGDTADVTVAKGGPPSGDVLISNWPGYVDPGPDGTIPQFEQQSGVQTEYKEDVNDNVVFFNKLKPQLDQGSSGGRSLFVVTDWMAKRMYDLGYLQEINHADLPTVFQNILPQFEESTTDPERKFSIPWQGGQTGVFVDTNQAPEITSVAQLFDPKYKGKVTMLTEMRDTIPLVLQSEGVNPDEATKEDWLAAIDKVREARDSGQIRRFTGNEYTEDLTSGNIVAAIGWSGDTSLIGREGVEWRRPTDGCDLFFDQAVIPVGAPNTPAALAFLDFAYTPENAAKITEYVQYVTPVAGVQEILQKEDPKLANDPKIFPTEAEIANCSEDPDPPGSPEDVAEVEAAFQEVVSG
ncbi:MAG TPA: spermidine/putrescine ABC transporter substrate-binding protein [Solirubrobacterales bacterium]|nr:spermidine/putrescine ABC transporter substrate-binding protein [Solirubrobacterales bacterium]